MNPDLHNLIETGNVLMALPVALVAGVLAGLNPCCLPIYPLAAGCCTTLRRRTVRGNLGMAAAFVLGGCVVTTMLGVVAGLAGRVFGDVPRWLSYTAASAPLAFGLHLLGVVTLPLPKAENAPSRAPGGLWAAAASGAAVGLVVTPCATPVISGLLAYVATTGDPISGGTLLFVYGLGLGAPVFLLGTGAASLASRLASAPGWRWIERGIGLCLVGLSFLLFWRV